MVKIAGMSDIHGMYAKEKDPPNSGEFESEIVYPPADILCVAGDILKNYIYGAKQDGLIQLGELAVFNRFLGWLKKEGIYKEIVVVAGNHDYTFQQCPKEARAILTNAIYLEDSGADIMGLKFWGSPWQPHFFDWAFNFPQSFPASKHHAEGTWAMIPDDTDVLVTHGPPYGILDMTYRGQEVGCPYLHRRVCELSLRLHIFGHIHYSYGTRVVGGFGPKPTTFMNAAVCGEDYKPTNPIQVVEV